MKDELAAVQRRIAAAAEAGELDQARAPMLEALDAYRRSDPASFYPPGVPLLVPGRRVHEGHIEFLRAGLATGMVIKGVSDPSLEQLRVVA